VVTIFSIGLAVSKTKNITINSPCVAMFGGSCGSGQKIESTQGEAGNGREPTVSSQRKLPEAGPLERGPQKAAQKVRHSKQKKKCRCRRR
jgi:hypothetical protein